ncbi:tRNA glutamyl-Q(34) synthetase GluQRS [Piscinibacter sp. Jin2]|uniref:Glutamyl-Q tRNA(Asp) synthetase n=1 Tax=Aquariibacter lacus TaxID=2801332 RepID=A0A9X0XI68_9BURK|nr:tRNA glutamyl-Q(34) synthetase GluQRS [Piscinibacter lacus]MBL0720373.1 tRNA glutamyl-Q(34) synthetase GluQRS [Piscinibacter lacus]
MSLAPGGGDYVGRFAPSPTGSLHAGSLVAALASWLDARAHGGRWRLRIEDVDMPRCPPGAEAEILRQLDALGLRADAPPSRQSQHGARYAAALQALVEAGRAYPCDCTRAQIAAAQAARFGPPQRHVERPYPGTCRPGRDCGTAGRAEGSCDRRAGTGAWPAPAPGPGIRPVAWRLRLSDDAALAWTDRRLGPQQQDVAALCGDFVLRRADGLWAYQLAVVVDDAAEGINHIVRGEDLTDNTPRQILLQRALGLPTPVYLHTPLVRGPDGEKLSKQHGAPGLGLRDADEVLAALQAAGRVLGLDLPPGRWAGSAADWRAAAVRAWATRWGPGAGRGMPDRMSEGKPDGVPG